MRACVPVRSYLQPPVPCSTGMGASEGPGRPDRGRRLPDLRMGWTDLGPGPRATVTVKGRLGHCAVGVFFHRSR